MKKVNVAVAAVVLFTGVTLSTVLIAVETSVEKGKTSAVENGYVTRITRTIKDGSNGEEGALITKSGSILAFKCPICNKMHESKDSIVWNKLVKVEYKDAELCISKNDSCQYFKHKK